MGGSVKRGLGAGNDPGTRSPEGHKDQELRIMTVSVFRSMGTDVEVHTHQQDGAQTARNMFASYEQRFSRFLANSELSEINSCGSSGQVSADMSDVLTAAAEIKKRTRGLVDIGVGRAVTDWGYTTAFADLVPPTSAPSSPGSTEWAFQGGRLDLDPEAAIDLGGIVKGWAADRVVESGVADVVSAGGDLRSVDPTLVVEVADEHGTVVADVHVGVGALATSSRCSRRWKVGSLDAHHIIDPRTARPAAPPEGNHRCLPGRPRRGSHPRTGCSPSAPRSRLRCRCRRLPGYMGRHRCSRCPPVRTRSRTYR